MVMEKPFSTVSPVNVVFNLSEIADGTGKVKFYFHTSELAGGADQHLTTDSSIYSKEIETSVSDNFTATFSKAIDLDFDLTTFNFAKIIEGTAFFQTGFMVSRNGTGGQMDGYVIVRIRKDDGTNETEIASAQSETLATGGADIKTILAMPIVIPKGTHFATGETLRVTVEAWMKAPGGADDGTIAIGHDPRNRDGTSIVPSTDDPDTITQASITIPSLIRE